MKSDGLVKRPAHHEVHEEHEVKRLIRCHSFLHALRALHGEIGFYESIKSNDLKSLCFSVAHTKATTSSIPRLSPVYPPIKWFSFSCRLIIIPSVVLVYIERDTLWGSLYYKET